MHLIVGLGNPGGEYEGTRHNVGFAVLDRLAAQGASEPFRAKARALVARAQLGGQRCLLAKPQTFMNLSGESVGQLAQYFDIPASAVLVVHDELDFAPGVVRLKPGGGHGGHNGLRSLMQHLKGEFARVRLGVGKPPHATAGANYVLSRPKGAERDAIEVGVVEAADAVLAVLQDGLERAMGHINQHPPAKSRP